MLDSERLHAYGKVHPAPNGGLRESLCEARGMDLCGLGVVKPTQDAPKIPRPRPRESRTVTRTCSRASA